jgi:hypothetical protein
MGTTGSIQRQREATRGAQLPSGIQREATTKEVPLHTYDMTVYLGKQRQLATEEITATHAIVLQLIQRVEGSGHKIYMDSYFSSPLRDDLLEK